MAMFPHLDPFVPARLAASRLIIVHDVVGNEEECLEELDSPPKDRGARYLHVGEVLSFFHSGEGLVHLQDHHSAVELSAWYGVVDH